MPRISTPLPPTKAESPRTGGWVGGFGNVLLGVGTPGPRRTRSDLCAQESHPGATYNPWIDRTWCLCGQITFEGNRHQHVACCCGPLVEYLSEDGEYRSRASKPSQLDLFEVAA